jgi:hypothetical protein
MIPTSTPKNGVRSSYIISAEILYTESSNCNSIVAPVYRRRIVVNASLISLRLETSKHDWLRGADENVGNEWCKAQG